MGDVINMGQRFSSSLIQIPGDVSEGSWFVTRVMIELTDLSMRDIEDAVAKKESEGFIVEVEETLTGWDIRWRPREIKDGPEAPPVEHIVKIGTDPWKNLIMTCSCYGTGYSVVKQFAYPTLEELVETARLHKENPLQAL